VRTGAHAERLEKAGETWDELAAGADQYVYHPIQQPEREVS
jgi:hypothetical protein